MNGTSNQHLPWALVLAGARTPVALRPGDIVGRAESAALRLNEPQISEAHAMVSLRGGQLKLLALRGVLMVNGARVKEVGLEEGVVIGLGAPHVLTVLAVALPETVLALASDDHERLIPPPVASLRATGPALVPGFDPLADAVVWADGPALRLREPGRADRLLAAGDTFALGARQWRVVEAPLRSADVTATTPSERGWTPLRLKFRAGNVHILVDDAVFALDGMPASIVARLAERRAAAPWTDIARHLWPDIDDDERLRVLWDGAMARLRKRLKAGGIRSTLVRTNGLGHVELQLGPQDRIEGL